MSSINQKSVKHFKGEDIKFPIINQRFPKMNEKLLLPSLIAEEKKKV